MRVSIVIPAHNEGRRLPPMLLSYGAYFERLREERILDYELLVVINNSQDDTLRITQESQRANHRIRYLDLTPGGKGFAIIEGFRDALKRPNDLIGFVDADRATPPEAFYDLITAMGPSTEGVIAARWKRKSIIIGQTPLSRVKSLIFNLIVRALFLFPYSDTQCGAKLFKRQAVEYVHDKMSITRWAFDIDLLYKLRKAGFLVIEIPTTWENKKDSRLNLIKGSLEMFLAVVRLRLLHSRFSFVVRAYDSLPETLKAHHRIWT